MSVPDVAALINIPSLVPSTATAQPTASFVRWMLRVATVIIFATATLVGVQLAMAAPAEPPASTSGSQR